jgi:hypothetical protein
VATTSDEEQYLKPKQLIACFYWLLLRPYMFLRNVEHSLNFAALEPRNPHSSVKELFISVSTIFLISFRQRTGYALNQATMDGSLLQMNFPSLSSLDLEADESEGIQPSGGKWTTYVRRKKSKKTVSSRNRLSQPRSRRFFAHQP